MSEDSVIQGAFSPKVDRETGTKKQLWFSVEVMTFIKTLAQLEGKKDQDVIYDALRLLRWAIEESANSRKVGSFDTEGKNGTELLLPYSRKTAKQILIQELED